jgi:hypothetical protein
MQTGDAVIADFAGNDGFPDIAVPAGDATGTIYAFYENRGFEGGTPHFEFLGKETVAPNKALQVGDFAGKGIVSMVRPTMDGRWAYRLVQPPAMEGPPVITDPSDPIEVSWPADFALAGWSAYAIDIDRDGALDPYPFDDHRR